MYSTPSLAYAVCCIIYYHQYAVRTLLCIFFATYLNVFVVSLKVHHHHTALLQHQQHVSVTCTAKHHHAICIFY